MKTLIIAVFAFCVGMGAFAQQLPPAPKQSATIPPFKILKADSSSFFTNADLKKHRETIIMYFSPECDHCKHQTRDLIAAMDKFKDVDIVMATYYPFTEMKQFYENFHIGNYPNIRMGRDEGYQLPSHYTIHSLPFLALYDKKGKLLTTFEGNQKVDTLLNAFHKTND